MKWGIYRNEMALLNLRKQSNEQLLHLIHSFRKKFSDLKITRVTQSIRYLRGLLDNACSTDIEWISCSCFFLDNLQFLSKNVRISKVPTRPKTSDIFVKRSAQGVGILCGSTLFRVTQKEKGQLCSSVCMQIVCRAMLLNRNPF